MEGSRATTLAPPDPLGIPGGPKSEDAGNNPVDRYVDEIVIWGKPERVADQLMQYEEEMGLGYLLCAPLSQNTFKLFNDEVLPRIN